MTNQTAALQLADVAAPPPTHMRPPSSAARRLTCLSTDWSAGHVRPTRCASVSRQVGTMRSSSRTTPRDWKGGGEVKSNRAGLHFRRHCTRRCVRCTSTLTKKGGGTAAKVVGCVSGVLPSGAKALHGRACSSEVQSPLSRDQ
jgi:hypothetical protein